eukprot:GHVU01138875.1.p1 GENE.GHVU01138875.1~~GHVU01138875.1.p1  ORF type:complete len:138 (-),score=10.73 GHVU01138875.1:474-887(-)
MTAPVNRMPDRLHRLLTKTPQFRSRPSDGTPPFLLKAENWTKISAASTWIQLANATEIYVWKRDAASGVCFKMPKGIYVDGSTVVQLTADFDDDALDSIKKTLVQFSGWLPGIKVIVDPVCCHVNTTRFTFCVCVCS